MVHLLLLDGPGRPSGGLPVSQLRSAQVRLLVTRLAVDESKTVRADVLADAVWPGRLPPSWATALRGLIAKARRWFAEAGLADAVERRPGGYALVLGAGWSTDLAAGRAALADADAAMRTDDHLPAAEAAGACLAWTDGDVLDGYDSEWIDGVRAELRQRLVDALVIRATAASAFGEHRQAIAAARRLVVIEPYGEAAHRTLMSALLAAGDRGGAAQAHDALVRVLRDDLGVTPSLETDSLRASFEFDDVAPLTAPARPDAALFGRSAETAALHDAWAGVHSTGAAVVVVAGPAGIGKSTLVSSVATTIATAGGTVLRGVCSRTPAVPYEPLVDAIARDLRRRTVRSRAELLRTARPELAWVIPALSTFVGTAPASGDADLDRHRLFEALAAHVGELLTTGPVLLVVDDAHWASATTELAVRHVAEQLDEAALLIVLVERRAGSVTDQPSGWRADWRRIPVIELDVVGLDRAALAEFVDARVAGATVDVDELWARTGGNPLFADALLRADVTAAEPPRAVVDVIALQADAAGADATALLRALAALGESAALGVLRDVSDLAPESFPAALDAAVATGLVELRADRGQLRFVHGLARDAVTANTPPGSAMRLHARAGTAIEDVRSRGSAVSVADLARHFSAAAPLGHGDRALGYVVDAARIELAAGAPDDAIGRLTAGLELDAGGTTRASALLTLGHAYAARGDGLAALGQYVGAVDVAERFGDGHTVALAALGAMNGGRGVSTWAPGATHVELLRRALAAVDPADAATRIQLLGALSDSMTGPSGWDRRQDLARQALDIAADSSAPEVAAAALGAARVVAWRPEDAARRRDAADRVIAALDDRDDDEAAVLRADALLARASDSIVLVDRAAAERALAEVHRVAGRHIRPAWEADLIAAGLATADGDFDFARRLATGAADRWGPGHPDARRALMEQLGLIGTLADGVDSLVASDLGREVAALPDNPTYRCAYPLMLAFQRRATEAAAALDGIAADGYAELPQHTNWGFAVAVLAEAAARVGSTERLRELREMLEPSAGTFVLLHGPSMVWGATDRVLGLMSARLGEFDRAEAELGRALAIAESFPAAAWIDRGVSDLRFVERRRQANGGEGGI